MILKQAFTIAVLLILINTTAFGQKQSGIYIGQRADSIQTFVAQEVQSHYNAGGYLVKMSAETRYKNRQVSEVMLCKENVLARELQKSIDFCIHYVMGNGYLSHIVTKYSNITLSEAKAMLVFNRTNIGGYYFSSNFQYYSKVYADSTGIVIDDYRPTVITDLPLSIQEQLKMVSGKF